MPNTAHGIGYEATHLQTVDIIDRWLENHSEPRTTNRERTSAPAAAAQPERHTMTSNNEIRPVTAEEYSTVEEIFGNVIPHTHTRRKMLSRAAMVLAAAGGGALLSTNAAFATDAPSKGDDAAESPERIKSILATFEVFGVTFITEAVRRAPGTPSEQFLPVLKAANTTEYWHLVGLENIGATPDATRIWIPEALFGGGGVGLFESIEKDEDIEISAYLVGVTSFARAGDTFGARLCAEALGTEAVHRALARFAQGELSKTPVLPNDRGFESFLYRSGGDALRALEAVGVGFGVEGSEPGQFYDYPGNPLDTGAGLPVSSTMPM